MAIRWHQEFLNKNSWWGEDRDGFIVGFLVGVAKNEADVVWSFKTKNDSTIAFPLLVALIHLKYSCVWIITSLRK